MTVCVFIDVCPFKGWTIRKVMGGGWGIFELQEFFSLSDSLYEFFFRLWHEYFLGLIGVHEFFFHLIFPCANIFFVLHPPPPHKFSNSLSLMNCSDLL